MRRVLVLAISLLAFTGCVSEKVTYQRDLQPNYISRHARLLSHADREEIARLMLIALTSRFSASARVRGATKELCSFTAYVGAHERTDYGYFALQKIDDHWKIVEGGTDLDPVLVGLLCSDDR